VDRVLVMAFLPVHPFAGDERPRPTPETNERFGGELLKGAFWQRNPQLEDLSIGTIHLSENTIMFCRRRPGGRVDDRFNVPHARGRDGTFSGDF
jgi:hypothetical protein